MTDITSAPAEAPVQPEAAPASLSPLEKARAAIKAWVDEEVRGGPIAQVEQSWKHLHDSLPALEKKFLELF